MSSRLIAPQSGQISSSQRIPSGEAVNNDTPGIHLYTNSASSTVPKQQYQCVWTPGVGYSDFDLLGVNDAPVITTDAGETATEDTEYTYAPVAFDAENDTLTWTISNQPSGMTIDSATGAISWTPTEGVTTSGSSRVTITVTDDGSPNKNDTENFDVTVTAVNDAGTVSIAGTVTQGETLTAAVTDIDGISGTITYQWKANGVDIGGATSQTYVLTPAEVGKTLTVIATYTDDGNTAETLTSLATASVVGVPSGNGAASIPTLSQWTQYLLILMLALVGGRAHFLKKGKSES